MQYMSYYESPLGLILLTADEVGLTGLHLEGQRHYAKILPRDLLKDCRAQTAGGVDLGTVEDAETELPVFAAAKHWLDQYFYGQEPKIEVPIHLVGTDFQKEVWKLLCKIPYGQTTTYGQIARQIARQRGIKTMSAQAVGGAVGHNPIAILVPCHRVIGADGSLTGYDGGLEKKVFMLELEERKKDFT